jgi:hypothetical protein
MKRNYFFIFVVFLSIFSAGSAESEENNFLNENDNKLPQDEHNNITRSSLIFQEELNKCPMYTPICSFSVLINKSINIDKIKFESSDLFVFKNITIKLCDQDENDKDLNKTKSKPLCSSLTDFKSVKQDNYNDYLIYKIYYVPDLVGVAELMININDSENIENNEKFNYTIIVVQPKRVIDLVFDIYVWTFSLIISTLMGILIDRDALKAIIKMPIPVIIGFVCQYLCMPLVLIY